MAITPCSCPDVTIAVDVLKKMPPAGTFRGLFHNVKDMDGKSHTAIRWQWLERGGLSLRLAHFDKFTGEYLGEHI